jgi:hypothetical protein
MEEKRIVYGFGKKGEQYGDRDADGRIILKWILEK